MVLLERDGFRLAELLKRTGFNKSTVYKQVAAHEREGLDLPSF